MEACTWWCMLTDSKMLQQICNYWWECILQILKAGGADTSLLSDMLLGKLLEGDIASIKVGNCSCFVGQTSETDHPFSNVLASRRLSIRSDALSWNHQFWSLHVTWIYHNSCFSIEVKNMEDTAHTFRCENEHLSRIHALFVFSLKNSSLM